MTDHLVETLAPSLTASSARRWRGGGAVARHRTARAAGDGAHRAGPVLHQPVDAAGVPAGASARRRLRHRRRRRQPLPRPQRRYRRQRHRPLPPRRSGRHRGSGPQPAPLLLQRLLPPDLRRAVRAVGPVGPVRRRTGARVPRELRHRGRRRRAQAGSLPHQTPSHRGVPRWVPRPHARVALAHGQQGALSGRLRPIAARRAPRALRAGGAGSAADAGVQAPRGPWGGRRHRRGAGHGRGRLPPRSGRVPGRAAVAVRRARHPARGRRGPVRRRPHRALLEHRARRRRARRRPGGQGPGQRSAPGSDHRPGRSHDVAAGHARLDLRRQPRRLRGGAGHHRPRGTRVARQRGGDGRAAPVRPPGGGCSPAAADRGAWAGPDGRPRLPGPRRRRWPWSWRRSGGGCWSSRAASAPSASPRRWSSGPTRSTPPWPAWRRRWRPSLGPSAPLLRRIAGESPRANCPLWIAGKRVPWITLRRTWSVGVGIRQALAARRGGGHAPCGQRCR